MPTHPPEHTSDKHNYTRLAKYHHTFIYLLSHTPDSGTATLYLQIQSRTYSRVHVQTNTA